MNICVYSSQCNACSSWGIDYFVQKNNKINHLKTLLKEYNLNNSNIAFDFTSIGECGLRYKSDFALVSDNSSKNQYLYGYYDKKHKVINIEQCLQYTAELQKVYSEFIKICSKQSKINFAKASIRLRVGPTGKKGCWLDLANIDIKNLLEDRQFLVALLEAEFQVEIGQKKKKLSLSNDGFTLKLIEPTPDIWFQTQSFKLLCHISSFTQPSWKSADSITDILLDWLNKNNLKNIIEFGSGIGQFSLPILNSGRNLICCEIDSSASELLALNTKKYDLNSNLQILVGNFHQKEISNHANVDCILVNPARSGLKKFTEQIINISPAYVIYVSCFPESMVMDLKNISNNYEISKINIIDQFPQTEHYESCVLLKKLS